LLEDGKTEAKNRDFELIDLSDWKIQKNIFFAVRIFWMEIYVLN
jgi:hypothetical protein